MTKGRRECSKHRANECARANRGDPNVRIGNFVVEITGSTGASLSQIYRQVAQFVATVFRGEKPDNVPVQQPTNFKLVINLKTATAIGHSFCCADKIIE